MHNPRSMLLSEAQVTAEFYKYGLIVSEAEDIPGIDGLIKNVALTLGGAYAFKGSKAYPESIYPFPRYNIGNPNNKFFVPPEIFEAQLYVLIHDKSEAFLATSFNRNYGKTYMDEGSATGSGGFKSSSWQMITIKDDNIYSRVAYMLRDYIHESFFFEVKHKPKSSIMITSNDKYNQTNWDRDVNAASKNALRDKFYLIDEAIKGKVSVDGSKTLSSNDFTTDLKNKLESIEDNATADQTNDEIADAYDAVRPFPTQAEIDNPTPSTVTRRFSLSWLKEIVNKYSPPVSDEPYNSGGWDGDTAGASKNSIRDKIESILTLINSKINKTDIVDALDDTSSDKVLSSRQGNQLKTNIQTHIGDVSNPHSVTQSQIGLSDVDNTADNVKTVLSSSKLTTARDISLTGDVTGSVEFDGSANVNIATTVAGYSHDHDSDYEAKNPNIQAHIGSTTNPHSVTQAQIGLGSVDNTADSTKSVLGASKLTTARNISLSGDVTGSVSFDGSSNANIAAVVADDSHNHTVSNVDGLQATLDNKVNTVDVIDNLTSSDTNKPLSAAQGKLLRNLSFAANRSVADITAPDVITYDTIEVNESGFSLADGEITVPGSGVYWVTATELIHATSPEMVHRFTLFKNMGAGWVAFGQLRYVKVNGGSDNFRPVEVSGLVFLPDGGKIRIKDSASGCIYYGGSSYARLSIIKVS